MGNNPDQFDDFFSGGDDDFFNDDAAFGGFDSDDSLLIDDSELEEEQGGTNRTFLVVVVLLVVAFVVLAIAAAVLLIFNRESCNTNCVLATEISATNAAIEQSIRSSETAISEQSTATQIVVETQSAESTATAIVEATATTNAENTQVAATETQQSVDATSTQISAERTSTAEFAATETALAPTATETAQVAQAIRGRLQGSLAQEGLTICIFRDDGDGVFNPSTNVPNPNCSPEIVASAPEESGGADTTEVIGTGGAGEDSTETGEDTAETGEDTTELAAPTQAPLNAIFQTATAAAALRQGIATPTPEGSSFNAQIRGKAIPSGGENAAPQQTGGEDEFETSVITEANGEFVIPPLPPGEYWIAVGDQQLQIRVQDTVSDQVFTFPSTDGAPIVIRVEGTGNATVSPIILTATALALQNLGVTETPTAVSISGNPQTQTAVAEAGLPTTGLFDGKGGDVTGTDLLILAIMGLALLAVIFMMRSARSALSS